MNARKPRDIENALQNKFEFVEDPTRSRDHRAYVLRLPDLPPIRAKVPHSKDPLRAALQGIIAKELRVRSGFYDEMMSCTKSKQDYYTQVGTDPYPPWDIQIVTGSRR